MYIGNIGGPTVESVIATESPRLLELGCPHGAIEEDLEMETLATQRGDVEPAELDANGSPFFRLMLDDGKTIKHDISKYPSLPSEIHVGTGNGGIGIAEQVATHQWRLKIVPSTPTPEKTF